MAETQRTRVALVTGASRGLGETLARVLARRGFDLVLSARGADDLERVAESLRARRSGGGRGGGVRVRTVAGDLAEERTREELVQAAAALGGLDLLINNASELGGLSPIADVSVERLERLWRINVIAPLALTRLALPVLAVRRGGAVVNISSDAALGAYAGWGAYGSTKAALDLITRTLATEVKDRGVTVVGVDPGDMRTRMHQEALPGEDISDRPLPDITIPFFEWMFDQLDDGDRLDQRDQADQPDQRAAAASISGERFQAQAEDERWAVRV
jgi:NAD(P)-dependent dehydrogenase (short-subunit alcohol dehydrogenase family)